MLPRYQVYANGRPYWEPVTGQLQAMAVYMSAVEEFGRAEIKPLTERSELGESKCTLATGRA